MRFNMSLHFLVIFSGRVLANVRFCGNCAIGRMERAEFIDDNIRVKIKFFHNQ